MDGNARVYFLGYQRNPFKYLARSKIFVLPSLHEGFGNSLAEAMCCGLPVVASDCSYAPREILASEKDQGLVAHSIEFADYGVLLPPWKKGLTNETEKMWAECIVSLMENEPLQKAYSKAASTRIRDFETNKIHMNWLDVIRDIH